MSIQVVVALMELFLGVWNTPPISLGEVALREAVRRHAVPASVRSITGADLGPAPERPARPVVAPGGLGEVVPEGKPGDKPPTTSDEKEVRNEAWWRSRIMQARAALERDRVLVGALESRVAALTRDVASRDDPAQRAVLMAERVRALEELDLMRKQVTADTQAIEAIEDDARREGVPPGWLRGGG